MASLVSLVPWARQRLCRLARPRPGDSGRGEVQEQRAWRGDGPSGGLLAGGVGIGFQGLVDELAYQPPDLGGRHDLLPLGADVHCQQRSRKRTDPSSSTAPRGRRAAVRTGREGRARTSAARCRAGGAVARSCRGGSRRTAGGGGSPPGRWTNL